MRAFPRLAEIAEIALVVKVPNYACFRAQTVCHLQRLNVLNVGYRPLNQAGMLIKEGVFGYARLRTRSRAFIFITANLQTNSLTEKEITLCPPFLMRLVS